MATQIIKQHADVDDSGNLKKSLKTLARILHQTAKLRFGSSSSTE